MHINRTRGLIQYVYFSECGTFLQIMEPDIYDTEWGAVAKIRISPEEPHYISGFNRRIVKYRAQVFDEILSRDGFTLVDDSSVVPVDVAAQGKAALAAYLFAVHEDGREEIAERLSVTVSTVNQYLSDFVHDRR